MRPAAWARRTGANIKRWWRDQPDAFRRVVMGAWVTFLARMAAPVALLYDNVYRWAEGTGPAPTVADFVTFGEVFRAAALGLLAGIINAVIRRVWPAHGGHDDG